MQSAENSRSEVGQERLQLNEDIFLYAGERRKTEIRVVRLESMTLPGHT